MKIKFTIIAILLIASQFSFSQSEGIQKGDHEITFNGFVYSVTGLDSKNVNGDFAFTYGSYLSRSFLFGWGPGLSVSYDDNEEKVKADFNGRVFMKLNFTSTKKSIPYLNLQYYQYTFKIEDDKNFLDYGYMQGGLGLNNFINEYLAVDLQLNYGVSVKESSIGLLQFSIGLNYLF